MKNVKNIYLKTSPGIFDTDEARHAALIVWSVMKGPRARVIELLEEEGELHVNEIHKQLRTSDHSAASQLMSNMRKAGVVTCRKEGREVYYRLNKLKLEEIAEWFKLAPKTHSVPKAKTKVKQY